MTEATRSQMPAGQCPYGYGWWPQRNDAYAAIGIFGQSIFIDPRRKLVIVTLGNCAEPTSTAHAFARNAFWRLVEAAVDNGARS
jgi:CubicO group peptidase (beta-lactamase class C family)